MKKILALGCALVMPAMAALAQNVIIYDASVLMEDKSAPYMAVLTEDYTYTEEWAELDEQIQRYGQAHAFDDAGSAEDLDYEQYMRDLEAEAARFEREGNSAMAAQTRNTIAEVKKVRKETERMMQEAIADARSAGADINPKPLLARLRRQSVGGRFFGQAELLIPGLVMVREKDENGVEHDV